MEGLLDRALVLFRYVQVTGGEGSGQLFTAHTLYGAGAIYG